MERFTGHVTKGDVIVVNFPFTNGSDSKVRPALVVREEKNNITICVITHNSGREGEVTLDTEDFRQGKLNVKSYIHPTGLTTITKSKVLKKVGSIKHYKLEEVVTKLTESLTKNSQYQGEVLIVKLPLTDEPNSIIQHALVVAEEKSNIIICTITENLGEEGIVLDKEDFIEGRLEQKSYIYTAGLAAVNKSLISEKIGLVKKSKLEEVITKLTTSLTQISKEPLPASKALERPKLKKPL